MCKKILIAKKDHIEDWMILDNGSLILLEKTIIAEQNIKIYIHSNETSKHHRPHVHASYNEREYVISIDNTIEVIEPKEDKFSRYLIKTYFRSHLQYFRKEWNSICSSYKFSINDKGEYICA
mgnify:CR=1|jgi:hypothetical protein